MPYLSSFAMALDTPCKRGKSFDALDHLSIKRKGWPGISVRPLMSPSTPDHNLDLTYGEAIAPGNARLRLIE